MGAAYFQHQWQHFSKDSNVRSLCLSTTLVQTEISQQLLQELWYNLELEIQGSWSHTLGYYLISLVIS